MTPGPEVLTYEGFRVENPERLPRTVVFAMLRGIDRALALFKARGLEDVLYAGVRRVILMPVGERKNLYGQYRNKDSTIILYANSLDSKKSGKNSEDDWTRYVFVHEFAHFVHMRYLTREAREFFNSGWDFVNQIEESNNVVNYQDRLDVSREKALQDLGIPSDYGRTNVWEDFAETFAAYMANPNGISKTAKWRLLRAIGMSGSGGKKVMRLSKLKRLAQRVIKRYAKA
jgi:hypothetical protein